MANCIELGTGLQLPPPSGPPVQPSGLLPGDLDYTIENPCIECILSDTVGNAGDPSDGMDTAIAQIFTDLLIGDAMVMALDPLLIAIAAEESTVDSFDVSDVEGAAAVGVSTLSSAHDDLLAAVGGAPTPPTVPSSGPGGTPQGFNDTLNFGTIPLTANAPKVLMPYTYKNQTGREQKVNNLVVVGIAYTQTAKTQPAPPPTPVRVGAPGAQPQFLQAPPSPIPPPSGACNPANGDNCTWYAPDFNPPYKLRPGESMTIHFGFANYDLYPPGFYQLGIGFEHDQDPLYWALYIEALTIEGVQHARPAS